MANRRDYFGHDSVSQFEKARRPQRAHRDLESRKTVGSTVLTV